MCELRTEKPWQGDEGPGFKSRQLHQEPQLDLVLAGALLILFPRAARVAAMQRVFDSHLHIIDFPTPSRRIRAIRRRNFWFRPTTHGVRSCAVRALISPPARWQCPRLRARSGGGGAPHPRCRSHRPHGGYRSALTAGEPGVFGRRFPAHWGGRGGACRCRFLRKCSAFLRSGRCSLGRLPSTLIG